MRGMKGKGIQKQKEGGWIEEEKKNRRKREKTKGRWR